ncbi:MAG: hypothetical protein QNJ63_13785 [Calothrix sp. MO_192.B10]|nr:hypothetical protein [Calothrix sp. MO_192.B10]
MKSLLNYLIAIYNQRYTCKKNSLQNGQNPLFIKSNKQKIKASLKFLGQIFPSTGLGTLASLIITLPVLAEGSNQIGVGSNGLNVYLFEYDASNSFIQAPNQRPIYVNIFNPGEVINLSLCGWESWNDLGIEIFDPDGVRIFADSGSPGSQNGNRWRLSQGNVTTSSTNFCNHGSSTNTLPISTPNSPLTSPVRYTTTKTGTYEIRLYNESKSNTNSNAVFTYFDITVTPNSSTNPDPTENQGRVWARSWAFNAGNTFGSAGAYDANFYVRTPGGRPNTEFIWQLDLNQFAPQRHEIIGNSIGLNAPYSRYSVRGSRNGGPAGVGYTRDFPIYLSYPSSGAFLPILPEPAPPNVSNFRFVDKDGVDNSISPNVTANIQDKGDFKFTPDVDGTYEITIDTNQDGIFGAGDKILFGKTTANVETSVEWDGTDFSGQVLPSGTYNVKLSVRIGEYHFTTFDAETSGGNENGLSIWKATGPNTRQQALVYWDDATYLGSFGGQANLTGGLSGTTQGSHTWGNFASGGIGDRNFMDTWVIGNSITAQTPAIITTGDYNITGTVFEDYGSGNTGDNIKNTGENGIGSVTVQLFQDTNNNGTYEAGTDTQVGSNVVSAADGSYNFPNLANGTYFVKVDESDGDLSSQTYGGTSNPIKVVVNNGSQTADFPFDRATADLSVTKTDNQTSTTPGSAITYTVTVSNNGPSTVNSLTLNDTVPASIENPSFTPSTGSYNNNTGTWTGLNLASGQSITLTIQGTVSSSATGTITNTATVAPPSGITDPNNSNNSSTDTTTVTAVTSTADLSITKTDNQTSTSPGNTITYTITVSNNGPSTVNSLTLNDTLPTSIENPSFTPSTGSYDNNTGAWTGLNLVSGQSINLTIQGTVSSSATGTITNTATVAPPSGITDPDNSNNSSTDTTTVTSTSADNKPLGSPFICDATFYITIGENNANRGGPKQQLFDINRSGSTFNFISRGPETTIAGGYPINFTYNSLAYHPIDNYLYGYIQNSQATTGPYSPGNVVKIGSDGIVHSLGKPTTAPGVTLPNGGYYAAAILSDGTYIIGGGNRFATIDLTTTPPTITNAGTKSGVSFTDFAVDPRDPASLTGKKIYGINESGSSDRLVILDMTTFPPTITSQATNPTGLNHNAGSQFVDAFGALYYRSNSNQKLYKVDTDSNSPNYGKGTEITTAPSGGNHDGASCLFAAGMQKDVQDTNDNTITEAAAGQTVKYIYKIATGNVSDITGVTFEDDLGSVAGGNPINGIFTGNVTVSNNSGTVSFSNNNQTLQITNLTLPKQDASTPGGDTLTITAEVTVPNNLTAGTYYNQSVLSNLPPSYPSTIVSDYPPSPAFEDPTPLNVTVPVATNPNVLLVKRITAINGDRTQNPNDNTPLNTFVDDTTSSKKDDDNNSNWPSNYLIGAIDGGKVKPGEEVEYTIYFLSTGDNTAKSVLMCDLVPENLTFLPTAFNSSPAAATATFPGADRGIVHSYNSNTVSISGVQDGDIGQYFPPGVEPSTVYPNIDCDGDPNNNIPNSNGAVVVNLGDLPHATTPSQSNSYGFVRFRGKVK